MSMAVRVAVTLLSITGCAQPPVEPVKESDFVGEISLRAIDADEPVGDEITIASDSGLMVEFRGLPKQTRPAMFEGRRVRDPEEWPMSLVLYPRGEDADSDEALYSTCNPVKSKTPLPFVGVMILWGEKGYRAPPRLGTIKDDPALRFWTYMAVPSTEPGEYVYEFTLFPTSFWISDVRFDRGPPSVLKRGILRIVDKAADRDS